MVVMSFKAGPPAGAPLLSAMISPAPTNEYGAKHGADPPPGQVALLKRFVPPTLVSDEL